MCSAAALRLSYRDMEGLSLPAMPGGGLGTFSTFMRGRTMNS